MITHIFLNKKNYRFIIILFSSSVFGLVLPDFDSYNIQISFFQDYIGHRSILTHSILIPYIFYFYAKKNNKISNNSITAIIGLTLGFALHLVADIYPKGGIENELIKLPGNISIGKLSFFWIILNAMFCFYFSKILLNKYFVKKYYQVLYIIIGLFLTFVYALFEPYNQVAITLTATFMLIINYYYNKKIDNIFLNLIKIKKNKN
jgi:hypothetical protein